MPCIGAQLQQKLQLDYKTNIIHSCQKIDLYGIPTTKDLKKPHSSIQVGRVEMWRGMERYREVERYRKGWNGRSTERHGDTK